MAGRAANNTGLSSRATALGCAWQRPVRGAAAARGDTNAREQDDQMNASNETIVMNEEQETGHDGHEGSETQKRRDEILT